MSTASSQRGSGSDPHALQRVLSAGPAPERADATILFVHGRGASAESILSLYDELDAGTFAAIAPEAAGHSWYPHSFMAPVDANEPWLDSALRRLNTLVAELLTRGIPRERIVLLGFSQGACLALEFVARNAMQYGAVIGLTGGLIGPPGTRWNNTGSFAGTPVFLGAGDPDPHVPFERVEETETVFRRMGAEVELRRYPGMPHTINGDELAACRALLEQIKAPRQNRPL